MQRERLTITLDSELLQGLDTLIDGEHLRNRSQTIEHLLREGMGLHLLQQAFIFIQPDYLPQRLEQTVALSLKAGIRQFLVAGLGSLASQTNELAASVRQLCPETTAVEAVSSDFGTGGALMLHKQQLDKNFLIAHITAHQPPLPENLIPAQLFHRAHHGLLTVLAHSNDARSYSYSGLVIAQPEFLQHIPAGQSNIEESVFPGLVKESKVRTYPYTLTP